MKALQPEAEGERIQEIIDFCFGPLEGGLCDPQYRRRLFSSTRAFDAEIREAFGPDVAAALDGRLEHWAVDAFGRLALVVLLDQFTRNIHRGVARAFAGDQRALEIAREGVSRGDDQRLPIEPRVFLYMPFEHSESLADQETCLALLRGMREEADSQAATAVLDEYVAHAREHHAIIRQFKRFPHRNRVLERLSSPAEAAWLREHSRAFGQH